MFVYPLDLDYSPPQTTNDDVLNKIHTKTVKFYPFDSIAEYK